MSRTRGADQLGDKLGPRLSQLLVGHNLALRRGLAPIEARIQQAATQAIIDKAGHEAADLYRPLWDLAAEKRDGPLHPVLERHVARVASGRNQWESLLGHVQLGTAGALGSMLSNVLFPATGEINLALRSLPVDAATAAQAAAAGLASYGAADETAGAWGNTSGAFSLLYELSMSVPDAGTLAELVRRGLLSAERAEYWLGRAAVPAELRGPIMTARRQLLTPADAALGLLRGDISQGAAIAIATENGMEPADFARLVLNTGEPPGAEQLAEALRRKFIDKATFAKGIRQSRVRDEWIKTLEDLQYSPVPTADAIDASLRGWITTDLARSIAEQNGVEPGQVQILLDNAGNPPSNEQLLELRRRGYISEELLVRGIRQGRTRDEWVPQIKLLATEPLTTADALDGWLRGHISDGELNQLLADNGLLERDWQLAKDNAGNPLALEQLLEAYRRKFIDKETFTRGFRESRYRDEWAPTALLLGHSPMSTADALEAALQGFQTPAWARDKAEQNGLETADFDTLYSTTGDPLSRTELQQLYNRGQLSEERYRQGLRESRLRNDWVDDALLLHVREPEAYQVLRWITYGIVTEAAGRAQLRELGYTDAVARNMIAEAAVTAVGPHKEIAAGEISTLFADHIIDYDCAWALLKELHYDDATATVILQLAHYKADQKILASGIGAIRSHYLAYRLDDTEATADLIALKLPAKTAALYLQVWQLDRLCHPKQLTEAQIVKAAKENLLVDQGQLATAAWQAANQTAGCERLVRLGYDVTDARLLLAGA